MTHRTVIDTNPNHWPHVPRPDRRGNPLVTVFCCLALIYFLIHFAMAVMGRAELTHLPAVEERFNSSAEHYDKGRR